MKSAYPVQGATKEVLQKMSAQSGAYIHDFSQGGGGDFMKYQSTDIFTPPP